MIRARLLLSIALLMAAVLPVSGAEPVVRTEASFRVTNRKYVSHILLERYGGANFVTMLTVHPRPWALHTESHPLRYPCGAPAECMQLMRRLDETLNEGKNIGIRTDGDRILEIVYYE